MIGYIICQKGFFSHFEAGRKYVCPFSTFEPALIVVSALQLRLVLEVQQQVAQDFTPLIGPLVRQQPFCCLNELFTVRACAQQPANVVHH